ncbi:hypothetical protein PRVXH_000521 [Proteinivorax hydrogeniformans]|uniref:Uncharacterized protein n=1 Tax=Proteinivorax hydrogeniformans TaxID=1826727 RepID=A0AAU8HUY8_9FIRM
MEIPRWNVGRATGVDHEKIPQWAKYRQETIEKRQAAEEAAKKADSID